MKWFSLHMRHAWPSLLVPALCLNGALAGEWKSQPLDLRAPVLSATQSKVLATFNGLLYELPAADSVWRMKQTSANGVVLAADSFHYFENGTVLPPESRRFPDLSSLPDECCEYRFAEDAKRVYMRGRQGITYYSEKSNPVWKTLGAAPPASSVEYHLMPFPGHYLLLGTSDLSITRNRGQSWEKAKGSPEVNGSSAFVEKIGSEIYASYVSGDLFRSADDGLSWSRMFSNESPHRVHEFNGIAMNGDTIWLSAYDGHMRSDMPDFIWSPGVLRSVDRGGNWEWHHQGLPNLASLTDGQAKEWYPTIGIHHFAGELWTTVVGADGNGVPYRSRDGGKTWQSVTAGLPRASPFYSETIGNEIRQRGSDDYYKFDTLENQWVVDSLLSPFKIRNFYSHGDTVYGQGDGHFQRKIGPSGQWENLFAIVLDDTFQYYPNGAEFIAISARPYFRMEHSGDGGRTWSSHRPFLPQTHFQNRNVEAHGSALYWPDDTLFTPAKLWHAFDDSISKLWNWRNGLLVQSGARLFHAAQSGGAWQELPLPGANLTFAVSEDRLTGYSASKVSTLAGLGSPWETRNVHFPLPKIVGLTKGRDFLFYIRDPQVAYNPQFPALSYRAGYIRGNQAIASSFTFPNHETAVYACSSYVLGSSYDRITNRSILDTVNYAEVTTYFHTFQSKRVVRQTPSGVSRALFADGDMMLTAHDGAKILSSKDRGKTWIEAASPPNITGFAGDAKMLFAVADSALHHIIDAGAAWTSAQVLARDIKQVSGTPSFLAIVAQDNRILVTTDTAGTWTTLPALPPGQAAVPTAIAAYGNEVFVGTQEYGIFGWSHGDAVSIRRGAGPETAKRPSGIPGELQAMPPIPRGWFRVPGNPGRSINAKGQVRVHPPAAP